MLNRPGWWTLAGAGVLVVAGRLFGIFELVVAGTAAGALVACCAVAVGLTRLRLDVARELHPPRVHAGTPSRVELEVTNRGRRRTPLLTLRDPVGPGRSATVLLAPLAPGESVRAAYRLPTEERGIVHIGPLQVEVGDPFGLTAIAVPGAPVAELTVWPAVEPVAPMPRTNGDDPHGGSDIPNTLAASADDFHALRPYVVGDDLRRVHWPSTARSDELMVRQDEMPWESRATVVLDTRPSTHTPATFERAVAAAASVIVACSRQHFLLRLVTTAGYDTGFGAGAAHVDGAMEHLATVSPTAVGDLATAVALLRRSATGGAVTTLLGAQAAGDGEQLHRLGRTTGNLTVLRFPAGRAAGGDGSGDAVVVDGSVPFAEVWNRVMAAPRRRRPASAR